MSDFKVGDKVNISTSATLKPDYIYVVEMIDYNTLCACISDKEGTLTIISMSLLVSAKPPHPLANAKPGDVIEVWDSVGELNSILPLRRFHSITSGGRVRVYEVGLSMSEAAHYDWNNGRFPAPFTPKGE